MVKEAMKRSGKWYRKNEADIILNDLIEKKEEKTVNKNKKVKKNK